MEDGEVHFFDDIYRLDADLERALSEGLRTEHGRRSAGRMTGVYQRRTRPTSTWTKADSG